MKSPIHFLLTGAVLLAAGSSTLSAQQPPARNAAPPARPAATTMGKVGLVDVGHIFTNYKKLQDRRKALMDEMELSDAELKKYQEEMKRITEELKGGTVAKGSEQWKQLERQLTEISAKGQAEMSNLRREFVRKEVQIYKEVYDEVAYMVAQYAEARSYSLVLRHQRPPEGDVEDPNEIMSHVNQLVVFHKDGDDITGEILKYMNAQYEKTNPQRSAAAPAAPAAPTGLPRQ